mmetsp:Transcript_82552/g.256417  ORF Transcript_82552/g.256417 Transcript_82552/m.256417 type:complete len:487 (+) Transcript_82552:57-1517(+)|eukprot:CAMPEP_0204607260 /NCGR_PEP_ID=MMETSP0661-20131031/59604_1 /ASSEMBLY_ACC=CAM_ASM_000606 /TAXON_ID=109239 /ORGANISM="Alexandrium margalefi, Strain AMGDE01CS-322" /LENGTH=486 /DNA_ID=CAMNT_0051618665 /DNA_START=37 /DNA_END=1497 /DNA_ORIENTATION=+
MILAIVVALSAAGAASSELARGAAAAQESPCPFGLAPDREGECPREEGKRGSAVRDDSEYTSVLQVSLDVGRGAGQAPPKIRAKPNVTAVTARSEAEIHLPFVLITAKPNSPKENMTRVEVHISSSNRIISVYLLVYVPLGTAWIALLCRGSRGWLYLITLSVTLCMMNVGMLMVNQSLAALTDAPMGMTCIQSAFLCAVSGLWSLGSELHTPSLGRHLLFPMVIWAVVACMYALHETLSHMVTYQSSLCERTVLMNFCPLLSHFVEDDSSERSPKGRQLPLQARLALLSIAVGAICFGIQMPDVTFGGITWVCILMAQAVPFRLLARWMLQRYNFPLPVLACFNSALILASSTGVSATQNQVVHWDVWITNESILSMLVISMLTFSLHHICELALLRATTATNLLVFNNIANVVTVTLAVVLFREQTWSSPCAVLGIFISIVGGIWYAVEMTKAVSSGPVDAWRSRPLLQTVSSSRAGGASESED